MSKSKVLKNVEVLFSNVLSQDDFTQKYQIVVKLTEEQAADAEAVGIKIREREHDGKTQHQAVFKSRYKPRIVGHIASEDLDLEGSELGRGSLINVQYKFREWTNPQKQTGTAQDLQQIQVIDRAAVSDNAFEDVEAFGEESNGDI